MFHFHLTKYWFNQFKNGAKRCEFRLLTPRLRSSVLNELRRSGSLSAKIYCGYPKADDKDRTMVFAVKAIHVVDGCGLPPCEKDFFKASIGELYYQFVFSCEV